MKKVPTIFLRDWQGDRSKVTNTPNPECDWVFAGEGVPTRKLDGTSCFVEDGRLFKRREIKAGQSIPDNFRSEGYDPETGKTVGWIPVGDGPEDKYHREAFYNNTLFQNGTYELVGKNIQGNPEHFNNNLLIKHGSGIAGPIPSLYFQCESVPRTFELLKEWMKGKDIEGIVFHHPDGRMGKIKLRDFGLKRSQIVD